jgi:DNA repair photolyase
VKLQPVQRDLDRTVRQLLQPFLAEGFTAGGWRLAGWDAEQGVCLLFQSGPTYLLIEFEGRNDANDCYARTARFNVCARRQFGDRDMTDADRRFVDAVIEVVRRREALLPDGPRPTAERPTLVREIVVDRLLMPEGNQQFYINPYVGCMIACPYCYVAERADFSRGLDRQPSVPWGASLDVKINAAEVLRREVVGVGRGIVRMSPILTDPYQSPERRFRITRQCLEVLLDTELAPVVLTRAPRVLDDAALLARFPRALVGFSIPTDDDRMRQIFEPHADPIDERVAALRALHDAGVRTFAVIQPVLPMDADRLIELLAPCVRTVRLDRMYFFGERMRRLYAEHGLDAYASDAYAGETIDRLTRGFTARGVRVDPLDDLEPLLDA